ncbi:hypothetical protein K435DRAFT_791161 [Dendrothele bispora CBS 962.96]|uniref:Uncharacterized protein n=1 Tax=Dendrothele bispora (strain CBS 962.96) TaxID=1314807 RepID=A0A4S8MMX5_DENBC|nr:hypothetical protein K435DRAFT_791161 [Dendrothele bispora CBS 962.96]
MTNPGRGCTTIVTVGLSGSGLCATLSPIFLNLLPTFFTARRFSSRFVAASADLSALASAPSAPLHLYPFSLFALWLLRKRCLWPVSLKIVFHPLTKALSVTPMVGLVWLTTTVHAIFVCHAAYHYLVLSHSNPLSLIDGEWSSYVSDIVEVFCSRFFARMLYFLTKEKWHLIITSTLGILIMGQVAFEIFTGHALRATINRSFLQNVRHLTTPQPSQDADCQTYFPLGHSH